MALVVCRLGRPSSAGWRSSLQPLHSSLRNVLPQPARWGASGSARSPPGSGASAGCEGAPRTAGAGGQCARWTGASGAPSKPPAVRARLVLQLAGGDAHDAPVQCEHVPAPPRCPPRRRPGSSLQPRPPRRLHGASGPSQPLATGQWTGFWKKTLGRKSATSAGLGEGGAGGGGLPGGGCGSLRAGPPGRCYGSAAGTKGRRVVTVCPRPHKLVRQPHPGLGEAKTFLAAPGRPLASHPRLCLGPPQRSVSAEKPDPPHPPGPRLHLRDPVCDCSPRASGPEGPGRRSP